MTYPVRIYIQHHATHCEAVAWRGLAILGVGVSLHFRRDSELATRIAISDLRRELRLLNR